MKDKGFRKRIEKLVFNEIAQLEKDVDPNSEKWRDFMRRIKDVFPEIPLNNKLITGLQLLSQLNNELGLKYLTHDWDKDEDFDLQSELTNWKNVFWDSTTGSDAQVDKRLYSLINTFVFEKQFSNNGKQKYWTDASGKRHNEGFSHPDWIDWCEKQSKIHESEPTKENIPQPWKHDPFLEVIKAFKHTTRLYSPVLTDMIEDITSKKVGKGIRVKIGNELDLADFYCFVPGLKKALEVIFTLINDNFKPDQSVTVDYEYNIHTYTDPRNRQYKVSRLVITHHNSFPKKAFEHFETRWKTFAGDMGSIAEHLQNVCDWSVQTKAPSVNETIYFRANILRLSSMTPYIEEVEPDSVKGFTHILTFYYQ